MMLKILMINYRVGVETYVEENIDDEHDGNDLPQ